MIRALFEKRAGTFVSARIGGHAGWSQRGEDIVCASVSSAVQLCANGITEIVGADAAVSVDENEIAITLREPSQTAAAFLAALHLHLGLLEQDYEDHIQRTVTEV